MVPNPVPNCRDLVEKCKNENPEAWANAHTGNAHTEDFIRLLAPMLKARDKRFGLNGKRGNPYDISDDAVNCLCDEADSAGRTPDGEPCVVIDVIFAAGAQPPYTPANPAPAPTWNVYNTTPEADGANVDPATSVPGVPTQPPSPSYPVPGREEALDEMNYLDYYYTSAEGLQRPNGLSLNGKPDFLGIAAWYLDVYQQERIKGKSRADARAKYINDIRHSDEWKQKHPGEQP